jgi:hypothetical protein
MTEQTTTTLYARLGGYDAIAAVADDLLSRLMADPRWVAFGRTDQKMVPVARNSC